MGFEFNKWAGAILMAALVVIAVTNFSGLLFHVERPENTAYAVAVEDHGAGASEAPAEAGPDLPTLLASADPGKGERLFKQCQSCHNAAKGGADGTGPNLWGVIGGTVGHSSSFSYSSSLLEMGGSWTFDKLFQFLENPKAMARGTKMSFAGLKRPGDRADLIAWLNQQSDAPVPLPAPTAAPSEPAPAEMPAPAEEPAAAAEDHGEAAPADDHGN